MDRINNDEPLTPTPMEIESIDTGLLPEGEATLAQHGVDNAICHKCGARIVVKNAKAHGARLTLWGHPAECWLFDMKCKAFSANEYERETGRAAHDIHHNSEYKAARVPLDLTVQALKASGIPSYIFQSKFPKHMSLVVELDNIVRQKMRGFEDEFSSNNYEEETDCVANGQKMDLLSKQQVPPQGSSPNDYEMETDSAAYDIHHNSDCYPSKVPQERFDQALLASGIPSNIFHSTNPIDKCLVVELRKIVKEKMSGFNRRNSTRYRTHADDKSKDERILEAKQLANRMECAGGVFQALVCIVCDRHIIGTEQVCHLTKKQLLKNKLRLGVESYNKFYMNNGYKPLHSELVKQYEVDGMVGLLLSQRSRCETGRGYVACQSCRDSITKNSSYQSPPKNAIANGFVIGYIPKVFVLRNKDGTTREITLKDDDITDILRAMLAPTRAYGYTFSYFAGAQQSIQGHYIFYEVDQTHMGSVLNDIQNTGASPHIHIVLGGRYTPTQKRMIEKKREVNTTLYTNLMTWFIQESGHPGYDLVTVPAECPKPVLVREETEKQNTVDESVDAKIEEQFDGGTYYFSSANDPSSDTGVHGTRLKFTRSLLNRTPPTLLAYGGDYKSGSGLLLEDAVPTAFPFGLGGPRMPRRNTVSLEKCLAHYGRLSLDQFMRGDFCLIAIHMLDRQLSYTSGKIKCRANIDGVPLAEKISQLTVKDLEDIVSGSNTSNSATSRLLTSVSASCKAMGHTSEAAAHWRRIFFALSDRNGMNAFMLTVTPNDLATFSVKVLAMPGKKHQLPSLDSTEAKCIFDFKLRKETRLNFPGACSLYFQSVMQIVLKVLLAWDPDTQTGKEGGIVGKLDAWGMAAEEQARKTLHAHLLLWSKKLSQMRDAIFDGDETKREKARADFEAHIDTVMSASYRDEGTEWMVEHTCKGDVRKEKVEDIFKECDRQVLRDARHKVLCHDISGNVMQCPKCGDKVSPQDIINLTLNEWHQNALRDSEKKTSASENLTFPLSRERHDIAMYRTSYDEWSGSYDDDPFWGKKDVRRILQISGDNEHYALHGPRCFKKGQECTSGSFPQAACERTCIHEDATMEGEDTPMLEWYLLDGSIKRASPWMILPRRPLGCQYLNTHNLPISTIFNCNSNVIIGDASNTFYLTLYTSKSTQKEDSEKKERIMKKLIRRLKRLQMERERNLIEDEEDNDKGDFVQGLSMMMSAMNASTSRDVVSSTMAHYLVAQGGSRFSASHKPKHLLLKQLEETLDDKAVNFVLRRTNKSKEDGTVIQWPDSTSDDYLYRPPELKHICAYEFTELYEKKFYSLKEIDDGKQGDVVAKKKNRGDRYRFHEDHPGYEFAYIERMRLPAVAVVSIPEGKLCLLRDLELDSDTPSQLAEEKRKDYAKMALMMFYPFRKEEKDKLEIGGSYWTLFDRERIGYFKGEKTVFWKTGFEILQNIDDREMMMQSDKRVRARDPVLMKTKLNEEEAKKQKSTDDRTVIPDISQFCDDDESIYAESDAEDERIGHNGRWSHNVLVGKVKNITNDKLISARVVSDKSILQSPGCRPLQEADGMGENAEPSRASDEDWFKNKSYPTLLKFVSGTLVGPTNYDDIYGDDLMEINTCDNVSDGSDDDSVHVVTQDDMSQSQAHSPTHDDTTEVVNIPTLVGVARKVAQQDKVKLDEKQHIAYEIIACTFLLELIEEGRDKSSILGQYLGSALGSIKEDMDLLVEQLIARGGMSQLLMFLTGPAGAGKSTAVKVAQRFCFEFCAAVSVMWHDESFYFTACSGSAAALFRGVTIHSAAFMNGRVTDKARTEWANVRILMVDEISYMSDNDIKKLDRKLKDLNGIPNKPFGGQSIIFSGDFRQFEAILAKYLLYDRHGSQHWENSINCVIILENIHRFKDDPEYGQMLTRLWRNDLTQEDREKINTRVVGQNGVTLPPTFDGDVVYACATNKERNAFQAGIFRNHILNTHPKINSPELPPDHTIIIEAVVQSSKSKKSSSSIGGFTRDRIIHTCGDADCVLNDSKYIDPALRLYVGAHCMCIVDNKRLKDKVPIGNGTLCRVVGIKLKDHAPSHRWQNWDGRKVWTVSAKHVDWVEFEYHPKSKRILELEEEIKEKEWDLKVLQESCDINRARKRARTTRRHTVDAAISDLHKQLRKLKGLLGREQQSRRFKLDPQTSSPTVSYSDHDLSTYKTSAKCKMTQIPVVLADSITGHKLQGMTLPHVIIASWGYFAKNWPYVVLSRSTTFEGLYLFQPIDMVKSFAPSRDLVEYLRRAEALQDHILQTRKTRMAEVNRQTEQ